MPRQTVFLGRLLGRSTRLVTLWLLADRHAALTAMDAFVGARAKPRHDLLRSIYSSL
jgi:hypothetical protein